MAAFIPMTPLTALQEDRKNLLLRGEYSDMKIVCQGITFKVHRFIMCPSSSFFTRIFKHPCQESATRFIQLPDDDPEPIA
ncbi:hypothetical protein PENSUB_7578 [Penicillium subrubescens]|uniref:BTB domain-containing protein n=1 Tax=Penicillium subrubescens TaxID=1316194 RepID=A0A1Q5TLC2_9EURO|nr:hypothetical protein PENSUB_7578 [Penicillium subrubescens]